MLYWTVWDRFFLQVLYLGRAPRTKETLPDFREKCRVTRHSRVFRGLTGSQRTPGFGVSHDQYESVQIKKNHITNGRMVEKTNDPKTLVKSYSTLISDTYQS